MGERRSRRAPPVPERDVRVLANLHVPAKCAFIEISESRYIIGENGNTFKTNRHGPTVVGVSDIPIALPINACVRR